MNNKQNALITYIIDNNDILKQTTFSFLTVNDYILIV